jgi:hypothetical protein
MKLLDFDAFNGDILQKADIDPVHLAVNSMMY